MFDAVKMMRSLSNQSFSNLESMAVSEGVKINGQYSKVELITAIIANRAKKAVSERKNYCITSGDDDTPYFVALTHEQTTFYNYLQEKEIYPYHDTIKEIGEVKFEAP